MECSFFVVGLSLAEGFRFFAGDFLPYGAKKSPAKKIKYHAAAG
jgi:hypothetical protein